MKNYSAQVKRRWRRPSGVVFSVIALSMLVPLAFIFGFHTRFPSVLSSDDPRDRESGFRSFQHRDDLRTDEVGGSAEDATEKVMHEGDEDVTDKPNAASFSNGMQLSSQMDIYSNSQPEHITTAESQINLTSSNPQTKDSSANYKGGPFIEQPPVRLAPNSNAGYIDGVLADDRAKGYTNDATGKSCQLEFGSYCLWSIEHKEVMKDFIVKRLKDQLFVARAYYPTIAKLHGQEKLSLELKQCIQEHERMLSEAISDQDLPLTVQKNIQKMDQMTARAKSCTVDCNNVDRKLRQILYLSEDETHFHMKQSAFLFHLGVQTMHKSFHCLSMRLTLEYFKVQHMDMDMLDANKLSNPNFRHYVIFSRNMLSTSVVINSTVMNSKESSNIVFHIVTDDENYYAMKLWFARNFYKEAVVNVLNFDQFSHKNSYDTPPMELSLPEEFRITFRNSNQLPAGQIRTEYVSIFGHAHFLLPKLFANLRRVIVLDDDVLVQQDLSPLWNLNLEGKVNGAVEYCGVRLDQIKSYLGRNIYNGKSCLWMSGLNVIDLEQWRKHNITAIYKELSQKLRSRSEASLRSAALPISLLSFRDQIYPLDARWVLSGLGHDYSASEDSAKKTAVLHYNGNMKPWLDLGIRRYKRIWKKFLTKEEQFMAECNVNP